MIRWIMKGPRGQEDEEMARAPHHQIMSGRNLHLRLQLYPAVNSRDNATTLFSWGQLWLTGYVVAPRESRVDDSCHVTAGDVTAGQELTNIHTFPTSLSWGTLQARPWSQGVFAWRLHPKSREGKGNVGSSLTGG